eukprot:UN25301
MIPDLYFSSFLMILKTFTRSETKLCKSFSSNAALIDTAKKMLTRFDANLVKPFPLCKDSEFERFCEEKLV